MCPNCCKMFVLFANVLLPGLPHLISSPLTGLEDYMKRYGQGIVSILNSFGPVPDFTGERAKSVINVSGMAAKETVHVYLWQLCKCFINVKGKGL